MPRDRSAKVTVYFDGLMVGHRNAETEEGAFWVVNHPRHNPKIRIFEHDPGLPHDQAYRPIVHDLTCGYEGITICPRYNNAPGVSLYRGTEHFVRCRDRGDLEDSRWIAELEGSEFHDGPVEWSNSPGHGTFEKITVRNGELYTAVKTRDLLIRETWQTDPPLLDKFLGKIADVVGLDIDLQRYDVLELTQSGKQGAALEYKARSKYYIFVENVPPPHPPPPIEKEEISTQPTQSDFSHYYEGVLEDRIGRKKFDLKVPLPPGEGFVTLGRYPQVCDLAWLSPR